jgi:hypothetical protein
MNEQMNQQSQPFQKETVKEPKPNKDDYIDFEEIK